MLYFTSDKNGVFLKEKEKRKRKQEFKFEKSILKQPKLAFFDLKDSPYIVGKINKLFLSIGKLNAG